MTLHQCLTRSLFLAVVLCAAQARAADATATPPAPAAAPDTAAGDIALFDLEELLDTEVASATKWERKTSEAPSIISVVTQEQADDFGWRTLNDILYRQPGFFPSRDYERRTVGFRGQFEPWNNNHLLLLIDGVPFNDNETGGAFTWEITPLFFMKNVEITRGPGSALYGSTAVNGVLAINTISPQDVGGQFIEARVRAGYPLTTAYDVFGGAATPVGDFTLGFHSFSTDGFEYDDIDSSFRRDGDGNLQTFRIQDQRKSHYFFGKVQGQGAAKDFSLQVHHQAWQYETDRGWLFHAPDFPEKMEEARAIVALKYTPQLFDVGRQEYVLRWQRHDIHHNLRFFEDGAFDGYYPAGVTEVIESSFDELFARGQLNFDLGADATLLAGLEYNGFFYFGDQAHYSNAALSDAAGGYPPVDGFAELGPYYEWVNGRPVHNIGVYSQLESGRIIGDLLSITLGLRYDGQYFNYTDITDPDRGSEFKTFQQLSPRIGVVAFPTDGLTFKALAGRAFRAPAPLELFGANSFAVASNIKELQPETLSSYELAADWRILDGLSWRTNAFYLDLQNQIAYGSLNVLVNIYSHAIAGAETELLFGFDTPFETHVGGFLNYTYAQLVSEVVQDEAIGAADFLTWAPSHSAKAGVSGRWQSVSLSLQSLLQGPVLRRPTDQLDPTVAGERPDVIDPFVIFDATLRWSIAPWVDVGVEAQNLADTRARIVRGGSHPWDYRTDGRLVLGFVEVRQ